MVFIPPNISRSTQSATIRKVEREFPLEVKFQHKGSHLL